MSNGLDLHFVQEYYQRMDDEELTRIATCNMRGLTPEALQVVKNELEKRGLNKSIADGVEAQNRKYTLEEVDAYCEVLRTLPCPVCSQRNDPLNATETGEVMSFIFISVYNKRMKVGCPACLDKANNKALMISCCLGWWGIPWGIVKTVKAISLNTDNKKTNHQDGPNNQLRKFVLGMIGQVESYKNDPDKLIELLQRQNNL